ncbi:MAG: T9SS type A sorting domain-containing protein [Saprospiraceae bacterium]|nr:T9SS type A sorting domain-containing protein [Saprospiraceae bacterium]
MDVNGKIIQQRIIEKGEDIIQLDITNNITGVYFINIKLSAGRIMSAKVIRQ